MSKDTSRQGGGRCAASRVPFPAPKSPNRTERTDLLSPFRASRSNNSFVVPKKPLRVLEFGFMF